MGRIETLDRETRRRLTAHRLKWADCRLCPLAKLRFKVVITRGTLPCEILFVGEAPGESEDLYGYPFIGPAGKLQDDLVADACERAGYSPSFAYTNIVCCLPIIHTENGQELRRPTRRESMACQKRLRETIRIARPKLIVTLGKIAKSYLSEEVWDGPIKDLIHPSHILRERNEKKKILGEKKFIQALSRIINAAFERER
jgi:uracil-DNA glycosylase family 4